jgi:uncharacterized protein YqhQ
MIPVAGFARLNGITFIGPKHQVTTTTKNGVITIKHRKTPRIFSNSGWWTSVPLLRGAWMIVAMLGSMVINSGWLAKTLMGFWLMLNLSFIFWPNAETVPRTPPPPPDTLVISINPFDVLFFFMVIAMSFALKGLWQYHAAEHMSINTHEAGKSLDVKNIQQSSQISPRCGSNIVVIIFLVQILLFRVLDMKVIPFLDIAIMFAISYEIHRWQFKPFLWLGYLVQKYLVTRKPNEYHLVVGSIGLESLISLEETGQLPKHYAAMPNTSSK